MATVTGFESLRQPTKSEMLQFAELFQPLYSASSEEARRQAVAALSQCRHVPRSVVLFIASQPISIAAPFLSATPCLDDELMVLIARMQGIGHVRAMVRREKLSPAVIDALVGLRHETRRELAGETTLERDARMRRETALRAAEEKERRAREESVRRTIKTLAGHGGTPADRRLGLRTATDTQTALLVRFARSLEIGAFATALADALSSSRFLAERIMLDASGHQLATTLVGLDLDAADITAILSDLYPKLAEREDGIPRAEAMLQSLDPLECEARIDAWHRADSYTYAPATADRASGADQAGATQPAHEAANAAPAPRLRRQAR